MKLRKRMKNIIIFNYEMNENSKVLAFCIDWVNAISKYFDKIFVITLRKGKFIVNSNVEVFSLDSDKVNRFNQINRLYKILFILHKNYKINGYFVHMAHKFVPLIYPFAKYYNKKVVLWYAHKSIPFDLKVAVRLSDKIFSVSPKSMRLNFDKVEYIGHGIDTEKRFSLKENFNSIIKNIVTVGRISKVKNTDLIVKSFLELNDKDKFLYIVGDAITKEDKLYLDKIKKIIPKERKNNIIFLGSINFDEIVDVYKNMDLSINLSDTGSLDKAIIESMAMGIPVITSNDSAKELFKHLNNKGVFLINKYKLGVKLKELVNNKLQFDPLMLREEVEKNHSLNRLVQIIIKEFFND
jgi:glycosyltransferase involved in cell wall biosynthesis